MRLVTNHSPLNAKFASIVPPAGSVILRSAQLFLPRLDHVIPRRDIVDLERTIVPRHCKVRMWNGADIRMHPAMDVAFHRDHDFRSGEFSAQWLVPSALAVIPFPVCLCEWVNVVCNRI